MSSITPQRRHGERILPLRSTRKRKVQPNMMYLDEQTDTYVLPEQLTAQPPALTNYSSLLQKPQDKKRQERVEQLLESKLFYLRKQQREQRYATHQWDQDYLRWSQTENEEKWDSDSEAIGPAEQALSTAKALRFAEQFMDLEDRSM
ncbi:Ino80 complex subunit Iec5 [Schizosaccharomyces japonicus yFS275]|uniref:Ino80 complex subunit Iec5 n=1 Tax=Schizosaccharomyces japonicus (strain yFS275 / FY16936) TaxID=402676 RepID=B6K351_SCHJY|nr:Ino80 complex subunit Iec5 [Schizosaccharomyces japonicus yFS275]EEB07908.1 Ino80 complex subunit Iec5 [Schizosaccharomyces japonicus yFS275]